MPTIQEEPSTEKQTNISQQANGEILLDGPSMKQFHEKVDSHGSHFICLIARDITRKILSSCAKFSEMSFPQAPKKSIVSLP